MTTPFTPSLRWHRWLPLGLLLALSYLPLFWLLGSLPAQQWDEARTGLNALGIGMYHDWIVLRHLGEPDLWNGKPPLWSWVQFLSFQALGPTELALRLPAALAGLATVLLVYRAGTRWLGSAWAGLLAGLILLTTQGYVTTHVTRSGDYDALLTLWTTAGALNWLSYLRTGRPRWAWLTGVCFALAVLTKGIAGVLFGPGLVLALALTKTWPRLRRPAPWLAAALVVGVGLLWYIGREYAEPGYWAGVWLNEVGGLSTTQMEQHYHPIEWYLSLLAEYKFTAWIIPALLGWLIGYFLPAGSPGWWVSRWSGAIAASFLLIVSLVQTRLHWYDAPVYPILALQAAMGLVEVGRALTRAVAVPITMATKAGGVLVLAALPYLAQWQHIRELDSHRLDDAQLLYGRHIRKQVEALPELREYTLVTDGSFNDSPQFYRAAAELRYGHQVSLRARWDLADVQPGQTLVACGEKAYRPLLDYYHAKVVFKSDSCLSVVLPDTLPR